MHKTAGTVGAVLIREVSFVSALIMQSLCFHCRDPCAVGTSKVMGPPVWEP